MHFVLFIVIPKPFNSVVFCPTHRVIYMELKKYMIVLAISAILLTSSLLYSMGLQKDNELVLATTTSTYDSGLLDEIIPDFEEKYDVKVKIISVGTGQALRHGRDGDVDVLLVHAPEMEEEFIEEGHGLYRNEIMYNQFIIVGPGSDPAGIGHTNDSVQAFTRIYETKSKFCSRGDDSGTHTKEKYIWTAANFNYSQIYDESNAEWYMSLGQGMGSTLNTAEELQAYTLTDEGTYYFFNGTMTLVPFITDDPDLFNQYSVIPINSSVHPNANQELAESFSDWMASSDVQKMIDDYTKNGRNMFTANAGE